MSFNFSFNYQFCISRPTKYILTIHLFFFPHEWRFASIVTRSFCFNRHAIKTGTIRYWSESRDISTNLALFRPRFLFWAPLVTATRNGAGRMVQPLVKNKKLPIKKTMGRRSMNASGTVKLFRCSPHCSPLPSHSLPISMHSSKCQTS